MFYQVDNQRRDRKLKRFLITLSPTKHVQEIEGDDPLKTEGQSSKLSQAAAELVKLLELPHFQAPLLEV